LQYVLIIDEINRGNISKILGEMITLLEPDKRIGTPGELKLPLSYSPAHRFAIPPNLHIIGTMNTADRSIALMDVALRRRFTFEELMPNSSIIRQILEKTVTDTKFIDLVVDVFEVLNHRIRFVYDRDHQLGHAYFLDVRNFVDLRQVFIDRIIPLLQEYFYGAWDKICLVLGCPYSEDGKPERGVPFTTESKYAAPIIMSAIFQEEMTIGFDHSDYEDRLDFQVSRTFSRSMSDEKLRPYFFGILPDSKYDKYAKPEEQTILSSEEAGTQTDVQ
jgi:5-methylcytosine-specific restriction protein B